MKFENLYRIIINEAEAIEDIKELATDTQEIEHEDELMNKAINGEKMTENDMINFLVSHSDIVAKGKDGIPLTPTEKIEKAKRIIELGAFESIRDGVVNRIEKQKLDVGVMEPLTPDLASDEPTVDDLPDVPGLQHHKKEEEEAARDAEEFGGQD